VLQLRWRVTLNDRKDEVGLMQISAVDKTRAFDTCIPTVPTASLEKGRLVNWQLMMNRQSSDGSASVLGRGRGRGRREQHKDEESMWFDDVILEPYV
jgi:hypothetical protein